MTGWVKSAVDRRAAGKWRRRFCRLVSATAPSVLRELSLTDADRCLVLAPHADDEAIGLGGLLLQRPEIFDVLCLTNCSTGNPKKSASEAIEERRREFEAAMKWVGVRSYRYNLGITSDDLHASYGQFESFLVSAGLGAYTHIFLPHPLDRHPDHMATSRHLRTFCRKHRISGGLKVVFFEVWSPLALPNGYVDVSDVMEKKSRLINTYASQAQFVDYARRVEGLNRYRGIVPNVDFAECFQEMSLKDFRRLPL